MKNRTAIIILIILLLVVLTTMYFTYRNSHQQALDTQTKNVITKQQEPELSPQEKLIQTKIEERTQKIEEKIEAKMEKATSTRLTQEELDFLADPRKTVEKEVGISNK